jgi:hypothetical protein
LPPGIAKVLKRLHYPLDVILLCVRCYMACSLSLRDLDEMKRAIALDHSTVHRWVIRLVPLIDKMFRKYTSGRLAKAGGWTRRISGSRAMEASLPRRGQGRQHHRRPVARSS